MSIITRPLLASHIKDFDKLVFPIYASFKLDGIRAIRSNGTLVSRNFKEIPNKYIRGILSEILPENSDGEIIGQTKEDFNKTQSAVMSVQGTPTFTYCMFDLVASSLDEPYLDRMNRAKSWFEKNKPKGQNFNIELLFPREIHNLEQLFTFEAEAIEMGYEGLILRRGDGKYKLGRATEKEQILLKLKRFVDSEAIVYGFEEMTTNTNAQELDAFGLAKRSSKKEGMVLAGILGKLLVRDIYSGVEFKIGSGFNDQQKDEIWKNQSQYLHKICRYKHQKQGAKEGGKPRIPIFQGWRDVKDMDVSIPLIDAVSIDSFME